MIAESYVSIYIYTQYRCYVKRILRYDEKWCSWGRQFVSVPLQLWLFILIFRLSSMFNFFALWARNEHINIVWLSFENSSIFTRDFFRSSLFLFSVITSSCVCFSSKNLLKIKLLKLMKTMISVFIFLKNDKW